MCSSGYAGDICEIDINECESDPCHNGGICANTDGSFNCMCSAGFMGHICDIDINECESDPCQNGGTNTDGSFTCACPLATQEMVWMMLNA